MKRFLIATSVTALLIILALPASAQTPPPKRVQVQADLANLLNQEVELKEQGKKIDARDRDETDKNAALAKDIATYDAEQTRLTDLHAVGNYAVSPHWADGHKTGYYTYVLLRDRCPCPACGARRAAGGVRSAAPVAGTHEEHR